METIIDGIKTNYIIKGVGNAAVLLLHGWGANITLFEGIINTIAKKYKVLSLDLPGFGKTDEPKEPWCVDDYVEFILKFIKQMELREVILLGHSFGGRIIIKMMQRDTLPFVVPKIILTGSAGIKPKKTLKQKMKIASYKALKGVLNSSFIKKAFPDALDNLRKKNGSADYNNSTEIMRKTLVRVVNEDLTHLLENITPPTLLIWGKKDTATPLSDGELMEKKIKGSGLVRIENAGHYAFLEQPYIFAKVLSSFLEIGD